jgi:uncharacterized membrane protein SpoIIM required for sporulation/uncharacterized RDD family membrane protein YckC
MPEQPVLDYRQHLEVETPEHVILDYEIAGLGSRTLAAAADWLIVIVLGLAATLSLGLWKDASSTWFAAVLVLVLFAIVWMYFTCFEGLRHGQTPGKRSLGIRVIRDTGHAVTFGDAAARNLLLPVDLFGMLGLFLIAIHPRAKRLGDMVAGTVVVRDHPIQIRDAPAATETEESLGAPELADQEFRLLREFVARAPELPPDVRARLARGLVLRLAERYPDRPADDLEFLAALHRDELARRRGKFAARGGAGPGRPSRGGVVERMVARKAERWKQFQTMAERVSRAGLDALAAEELPDFARRYREVAADLTRVRTYGADPSIRARLERLVAAGHGALYRQERRTWPRIWSFIARECPAAIIESRAYVTLAFLSFMLPAAGGYALLRDRPDLAPELLPDVMLERAEAGVERQQSGLGFVQAEAGERPIIASSIISNNIRVAFSCFAGGIVFGVGSLLLLAYNGLSIGASSGHFANAGLLGYLWTFVIGHGVLELFAIWVSGAAGFMLGRAIIAPGELPRRDAVVLAGRQAMRLIGAVVVMLLVAGVIEGFVSASDMPVPVRIGVSGASVLFLVLYLLNGALSARNADRGPVV